MSHPGDDTGFYHILVAIETDATRYYGANASRPRVLEKAGAEQLLAHVAADLKALLPDISGCSLITAGALFDQTQVLRPAFPVFAALEQVALRHNGPFRPGLVSIGAESGRMPVAALQPLEDIPLGLLQLLPIVVHGPKGRVEELGQAMEYRFLEEGQVSAHTANGLKTAFDISVNHARLMTLTDLNAMLRLQLEHFGFLPLWELLDAALGGRSEPLDVTSGSGQSWSWRDGAVHSTFQTFDHWAVAGEGSGMMAAHQGLAVAYAEWTRELRQYLTTLTAHGLEVRFHLPGQKDSLEGGYFCEKGANPPVSGSSAVTEHSYGELGTIAVTAAVEGQLEHYYPLNPGGLNDINAHLRDRIPGGHTVAFPGTILYDEKLRCLVADSFAPDHPH
jgi:hypothetical protein